ncbi:DUF3300 domain-containing protein [Nitratifractor sp.]
MFTRQQFDTDLAPIALYPDPLLAQVLMASTYPEQIEEAWNWRKEQGKISAEKAFEEAGKKPWDPSVVALTAFPDVLEMLATHPEWAWEVGELFLADPDRVFDTIQQLRKKAKEAGNLIKFQGADRQGGRRHHRDRIGRPPGGLRTSLRSGLDFRPLVV